jgi:hypothetical protein
MNNNNFIEQREKPSYTKSIQESRGSICHYKSRKQIRSTKFTEGKLGTYTIAQSRRDLRKENLRRSALVLLFSKSR